VPVCPFDPPEGRHAGRAESAGISWLPACASETTLQSLLRRRYHWGREDWGSSNPAFTMHTLT